MTRKKKSQQPPDEAPTNGANASSSAPAATSNASASKARKTTAPPTTTEPSTSALIICRNKHWRYISSFHGPWLQLPPEVLESLAHANYLSPRPHQIDPAVFYDIVKIRKAVDEATNLAVRATSGLTSAQLGNSLNAANSILGGYAALGLGGSYGGGGNTKLSAKQKLRMRELATSKLSQAYQLDEIAASVATMQAASTLEDVAQLVLQRNPEDIDAKYVHFFHEKIPSRMMAQCTPLDVLDHIVAERPTEGSPLRTRALTRIFKDDYVNAARDLTEGLVRARILLQQHRAGKDQLVLAKAAYQEQLERDFRHDVKVPEEDQPSSLETQLLFHRAGAYFTVACLNIDASLAGLREYEETQKRRATEHDGGEPPPMSAEEKEGHRKRLEARKQVKQNARRALRDYLAFLSRFEYTPGMRIEVAEEIIRKMAPSVNGNSDGGNGLTPSLESDSNPSSPVSDALVTQPRNGGRRTGGPWAQFKHNRILQASDLFAAAPPQDLPPFPDPGYDASGNPTRAAAATFAMSYEYITYHPLLTDALHSLLLCHALLQTPPTELRRHAYNAARLARLCDGSPIFLAARSPARADWIEVLRRTSNWISLDRSWEALCRPGQPKSNQGSSSEVARNGSTRRTAKGKPETEVEKRERQKHEAILEALADERVVDEDSFQRAVRARERRFREDAVGEIRARNAEAHRIATQGPIQFQASTTTNGSISPSSQTPSPSDAQASSIPPWGPIPTPISLQGEGKRYIREDGTREYPISTERAEKIARWVGEAPLTVEGGAAKKGKKKTGKGKKGAGPAAGGLGLGLRLGLKKEASSGLDTLEGSVSALSVDDGDGDEIDE